MYYLLSTMVLTAIRTTAATIPTTKLTCPPTPSRGLDCLDLYSSLKNFSSVYKIFHSSMESWIYIFPKSMKPRDLDFECRTSTCFYYMMDYLQRRPHLLTIDT